jgi:cytidylate kinase
MPVIALTQGMGSLAQDIAEQLARDLNLATLQHEVAERVADRMHVSKSLINRLREGKAGPIERMRADRESLAVYTAEEVLDAAARGNVVLRGWGATLLLRPVSHVVCVRVARPVEKRVQWLMDHLEIDDAEVAEAEIRRSDHAHAARMNELFGVTWGDPLLFDLVLNTDRLSVDTCVEQIKALVARPEFAETLESRALLAELALRSHIRSALRGNEATREVNITIDSAGGKAVLRGVVLNAAEREAAAEVAQSVAGVVSVDNQLRVMAPSRRFPSAGGS